MSANSAQFASKWFIVSASLQLTQKGWGSPFKIQQWVKYEWPIHSLAHIEPSRLVMPFGVWFSFNFGNILFNLLFMFDSDSHSFCYSSCNKLLILFPKSAATIVFEASFSDKASFAASSASSLPFMPTWLGIQQKIISFPLDISRLYFSNTLIILGFEGEVCKNACRHDIESEKII